MTIAPFDPRTNDALQKIAFNPSASDRTKSPRHETPRELKRRIAEASAFVPLERLALGPQCGFATSVIGNRITVEDQKRKLRVICETADDVWG